MNLLFVCYFFVLPFFLLLSVWAIRQPNLLTTLATAIIWLQAGLLVALLLPVIITSPSTLVVSNSIRVDHLGAMFAMLTQLIIVSTLSHGKLFFQFEQSSLSNLRLFYSSSALLIPAMMAVFFCNNIGLMWICIEATTLCSAPLVYFYSNKNSLEAAWKYLTICGVGIAFALFGTMFIAASSQHGAFKEGSLLFSELCNHAQQLEYSLLKLGYLFCLLGYGTKAGMFPLHGWLPDAYSEAPAPASALLSGGLLNCSLFAIWRISEVVSLSGHQALSQHIGVGAGVCSVFFASVFLIKQHDLMRLFAYSSIESVGLMLVAIGLNIGSLFFALAMNLGLAKVSLFLMSGNIAQSSDSRSLNRLRGLMTTSPIWAVTLILGSFAVTGCPPFGSFIAEWELLSQISRMHFEFALTTLLASLTISFLAITMHIIRLLGAKPRIVSKKIPHGMTTTIPGVLILICLLCGLLSNPKVGF